jgi:hypothetical protein
MPYIAQIKISINPIIILVNPVLLITLNLVPIQFFI